MSPRFEWDVLKASTNRVKHGIAFEAALSAFDDPYQVRWNDALHSTTLEKREILVGRGDTNVILTIVFTRRGNVARLISVRRANRKERTRYHESEKAQSRRS